MAVTITEDAASVQIEAFQQNVQAYQSLKEAHSSSNNAVNDLNAYLDWFHEVAANHRYASIRSEAKTVLKDMAQDPVPGTQPLIPAEYRSLYTRIMNTALHELDSVSKDERQRFLLESDKYYAILEQELQRLHDQHHGFDHQDEKYIKQVQFQLSEINKLQLRVNRLTNHPDDQMSKMAKEAAARIEQREREDISPIISQLPSKRLRRIAKSVNEDLTRRGINVAAVGRFIRGHAKKSKWHLPNVATAALEALFPDRKKAEPIKATVKANKGAPIITAQQNARHKSPPQGPVVGQYANSLTHAQELIHAFYKDYQGIVGTTINRDLAMDSYFRDRNFQCSLAHVMHMLEASKGTEVENFWGGARGVYEQLSQEEKAALKRLPVSFNVQRAEPTVQQLDIAATALKQGQPPLQVSQMLDDHSWPEGPSEMKVISGILNKNNPTLENFEWDSELQVAEIEFPTVQRFASKDDSGLSGDDKQREHSRRMIEMFRATDAAFAQQAKHKP